MYRPPVSDSNHCSPERVAGTVGSVSCTRMIEEMLIAVLPGASSMPFFVMRKMFSLPTEYQKLLVPLRYQPLVGSFDHEMPGAFMTPSAFLNVVSMPPLPVRESESESASAMSSIVGFAHSASMTVCGSTGFPGGSV